MPVRDQLPSSGSVHPGPGYNTTVIGIMYRKRYLYLLVQEGIKVGTMVDTGFNLRQSKRDEVRLFHLD
jgi:hypothetical protein